MPHEQPPALRFKKIPAQFFQTGRGKEPVREWLLELPKEARRRIGEDIMTVEFGWPIGMPLCRPLGEGLHEVRTVLDRRIARVLFYVDRYQRMVLLHGFVKKTETTPKEDLQLARTRKTRHERSLDDEGG